MLLFLTALLAGLQPPVSPAISQPDSSLRARVAAWRAQREGAIVREFVQLLEVPNLATDSVNIRKNAALVLLMLNAAAYPPACSRRRGRRRRCTASC